MVCAVVIQDRFQEDLLEVPKAIAKKALSEIKRIKNNPGNLQGLIKLRGLKYIFRKRVADHRLILSIKQDKIKLLRLIMRNERTYNFDRLKIFEEEANKNIANNSLYEDSKSYLNQDTCLNYKNTLFTKEQLKNWHIPEQYWQELLNFNSDNLDDILNIDIPDEYQEFLIEHLYPSQVSDRLITTPETIKYQREYEANVDRLNGLIEGEIELSEYRQSSLLLDKHQQKYCDFGFRDRHNNKAILIKGAAGTGKTLIAFHRIKKLLEAGNKKILYVTYNKTLANYAAKMITAILGAEPNQVGVEILTVNEIVNKYYLQKYSRPKLASTYNQLCCIRQAIETVSINNRLKRKLEKLGDRYLLDEFLKVIESKEIGSLKEYIDLNRSGRKTSFKKGERTGIWQIYERWKEIIIHVLKYDIQEWVNLKTLNYIREIGIKDYDSIIIDEAQDLSPVALNLLILLVKSQSGLFLTADTSQSLYEKGSCWQYLSGKIDFSYITKTLSNSYRSTQSLKKACNIIISQSQQKDGFIDRDSLLQTPCNIRGEKPKLILTDKIEVITQEISKFFQQSAQKYNIPIYEGAILSNDYQDNFQSFIIRALQEKGMSVELMNYENLDINKKCIKGLNMYAAKGLEFPFVAVVGLTAGILPKEVSSDLPHSEQEEIINQQRRLFYVACTRATRSLMVIGSQAKKSEFLASLDNSYWDRQVL